MQCKNGVGPPWLTDVERWRETLAQAAAGDARSIALIIECVLEWARPQLAAVVPGAEEDAAALLVEHLAADRFARLRRVEEEALPAYLNRALRNAAIDAVRQERRRRAHEVRACEMAGGAL